MLPKKDGFLWIVAVAMMGGGVLAWSYGTCLQTEYFYILPRSPNTASGNICPLNIHGVVVYVTLKQQLYLRSLDFWPDGVFLFGAALYAIYDWRSRKRGENTEMLDWRWPWPRGFSTLEIMVVVATILILTSISVFYYCAIIMPAY